MKTNHSKSVDWDARKREAAEAILEKPDEYPVPLVAWARGFLESWEKDHPFRLEAPG